ncbi:helix-turn-helix transcriptional regulator [Roseibacterium beibuensis]|uniref:helix-turn-helix domain-containing protein n=1 Tax=[Roseibacterium] beibuensis TaxID=1193142 RepID=UPI00217E3E67|nr:helix-turn-helix transcriptional regulator [Roseibacterium beibuensis]MCS6626342.1 helix-turn-helix transcriptional regulator [Roseibacterium beibuensis]
MTITGPQCKAARALVEWPRDHVARLSGLTEDTLRAFERGKIDPGAEALARLRGALESGGAVFIDENGAGVGVHLKFNSRDARSVNRLENEGGPVGDDDV